MTATSSYRLALNGILLDEQEDQSGTTVPVPVVRRTYDITPTIQRGANRLSLLLMSNAGPPHVRVDAEVEDDAGHRLCLETDEQWVGRAGLPPDWLEPDGNTDPDQLPCLVEVGDMGIPPWQPGRATVAVEIPPDEAARRIACQLALILGLAAVTLLGCRLASRALADAGEVRPGRIPIVYLPLVPATLAIACGLIATYDPRIARQEIYQARWVLLALASVPLQWGLLALRRSKRPSLRRCGPIARRPGEPARRPKPPLPDAGRIAQGRRPEVPEPAAEGRIPGRRWRLAGAGLVLGLMLVGSWLRLRDIAAEPLHTDEVTVLRSALGLLERGFPSIIIDRKLPIYYICGSELETVGPALASLIFRDDCLVSRLPAACWGIATIPLIYWVGRHLFGPCVGLIAAGLYTFAATPIQMANFGRYPSQLQFFTLLTVSSYWRTIRGTGRVDRRGLAVTTAGFLGMFFSWEASALIAPGMVLAALVQRRRSVSALLVDPAVWAALLVALTAIFLQFGHGALQQAKYLLYGTGWADVKLTPMWRYPFFDLWRPVWEASWSLDTFLLAVGLSGAVLAAARGRYRRPVRRPAAHLPDEWLPDCGPLARDGTPLQLSPDSPGHPAGLGGVRDRRARIGGAGGAVGRAPLVAGLRTRPGRPTRPGTGRPGQRIHAATGRDDGLSPRGVALAAGRVQGGQHWWADEVPPRAHSRRGRRDRHPPRRGGPLHGLLRARLFPFELYDRLLVAEHARLSGHAR